MTIVIPAWILWIFGGAAALFVLGLAVIGAAFMRAWGRGRPFGW